MARWVGLKVEVEQEAEGRHEEFLKVVLKAEVEQEAEGRQISVLTETEQPLSCSSIQLSEAVESEELGCARALHC